jgi:hypothetical protein
LAVNRDDGTGVCSRCPRALTAWRHQQEQNRQDALPPSFQRAVDQIDQPDLMQIGPTDI